jgi:hypothetical protein
VLFGRLRTSWYFDMVPGTGTTYLQSAAYLIDSKRIVGNLSLQCITLCITLCITGFETASAIPPSEMRNRTDTMIRKSGTESIPVSCR